MQTSQPVGSPLGILLLIAAIYLVVKSPKRLQTLGRMGIAFMVTVLLIIVPGAIVRRGNPQAIGAIRWIDCTARDGDCGVVAHAISETQWSGNAGTTGWKGLAVVGVVGDLLNLTKARV